VRVKCLAQEHNTMSPARARTRTARSGDECTNHEATAPPNYLPIFGPDRFEEGQCIQLGKVSVVGMNILVCLIETKDKINALM